MDDVQIGIDSVNVLLQKRGLKILESREEYQRIFGFPIIDYYRRLGFDFDKEPYSEIAIEWVNEYVSREKNACVVDGVFELLEFFNEKRIKQVIISACEKGMLKRNTELLGVDKYFDEICGIDDIYASSKEGIAVSWRERNSEENVLFIGDTDHDCDVAKVMGADCALVAKGHQSYETLKANSEFALVFNNLQELKKYLS